MSLAPGVRLGAYEIVARLAGGMREVYRARDTKLGRDVALKVLPQIFTTDSDRIARFRSEALPGARRGARNFTTGGLWVADLQSGQRQRLLPDFQMGYYSISG